MYSAHCIFSRAEGIPLPPEILVQQVEMWAIEVLSTALGSSTPCAHLLSFCRQGICPESGAALYNSDKMRVCLGKKAAL